MRKTLLALLILILPSSVALVVYISVTRRAPTSRAAVGQVITIAGAGNPGNQDGPAKTATFADPFGIAVDYRGNVIVADGGESNRIRRITQDGNVKTIAGSVEGFQDGDALSARFNTPSAVALDKQGNIFIADTSNNRIRKLSADGRTVSTIAGSGATGFKDGPAAEAEFDGPIGVAVDRDGNVFVADTYNDSIRKISVDGNVTTLAGGGSPGYADGQAGSALFDTPCGVVDDKEGNLYIADAGNHAIRKLTSAGDVTTVIRRTDTEVPLDRPVGLVVTHDGFLFIADEGRGRIVRLTPEGEASVYAGKGTGFAEGAGAEARFSRPCGLAIDREGNLYVADSDNYVVREVFARPDQLAPPRADAPFIQPVAEAPAVRQLLPALEKSELGVGVSFRWPLVPQDQWHEIAGVVGEARGAPGGVALDHIHSGLDIRGSAGEAALSVYSEKVSSPIANWDFDGASEGVHVGLFSYIHIRVGRNALDEIQSPEKFKPRSDAGKLVGVRVRRGVRFAAGDFIGSLNRLNHVHLNLGPWNAQANPLALPFFNFKDTVAPTIEPNGIEVVRASGIGSNVGGGGGVQLKEKRNGRLALSGDVAILVTAYDRVDGNGANRKLGLYKLGYQLFNEDGTPAKGFEQPAFNIEFNRVPPENSSVFKVYAVGSGVSAYGTPTKFKYIATNRVRDGEALDGFLRTSSLADGNYTIKIIAEDYAGNRALGKTTELPIVIANLAGPE